jgi:hypothetical protein
MSRDSTEKRSDVESDTYAVPESDVAAWADRERKRRQAWLAGPSEEEKKAWARAKRRRRERDDLAASAYDEVEDELGEARHILARLQRNGSPALMMLASMLLEAPYRTLGGLLHELREWEDERYGTPAQRRRVYMDDED